MESAGLFMRRVRFRKGYRETVEANRLALDYLADSFGKPRLQHAPLKPKQERAAPRKLEAPVIAAISELLAVHPRVAWAIRLNSGMAYSGDVPVWFHKILRPKAAGLRMPDFVGQTTTGATFLFEAKAPGWTKPRNEREKGQEAMLDRASQHGAIVGFVTDAAQVAKALWTK